MLLSRVADSLYWMSRYLERAEHTARLIDVRLDLGLDRRASGDGWDFDRLFAALRVQDLSDIPSSPGTLIDTLVFDADCHESVLACVTAARENARQVREEISSDMWEQLNALFLRLKEARSEGTWSTRPHYICRLVIDGVHLFTGVTDATMAHGEGWQYLQAGPLPGARQRDGRALDLYFREPATRCRRTTSSGSALLRSCCAARGLLPLLHRRPAPGTGRRVPAAQCGVPAVGAVLRRRASNRRCARSRSSPAAAPAAAPIGWPAGSTRSLDYGQVDEILNEDPHAYLESIGRYCAQVHAAAYQTYVTYPIESALPA